MSRLAAVILGSFVFIFSADLSWGQIVINEVMADPASDWNGDSTYSYKYDEWVEIYNAGNEAVNLASFWLGDADSSLLYNFTGGLGAGRHRIVYGSDAVEWQSANGKPTVGLRLNNSGDTVMLWRVPEDSTGLPLNGAQAEPVLEDSYPYISHEAENDRSTGLLPDGGSSRMLFDGLNPYTGSQIPQGEGCVPTPGGRNGCPTPVERRSWGSVKTVYR